MDEREDASMEHFLELSEEAEEQEETVDEEDEHRNGTSSDSRFKLMNIVLIGVGVLIVILLVATFWVRGDEASKEDVSRIQALVRGLEVRVKQLEGIETRITQLEDQEKQLQQSVAERDESGNSVASRLDTIDKRLNAMREFMISVEARTEARLPARETGSQDKGRYHEVRPKETLWRIAKTYGLSEQELRRLNNITPDQTIHPGQRLLVSPGSRQ